MFRTVAVFIQSVLDIILPRKERTVRIEHYASADVPVTPQEQVMCGIHITTLTHYREKVVEDLVRALKYDGSDYAARLLAEVLAEYLREEVASIRSFSRKPIVLVPIPLHSSRLAERGFNQVQKILSYLPEEFKNGTLARIQSNLLIRNRATPQQTRLLRAQRLRNVSGAFELIREVPDAHIILVDDVTTTGATLSEAVRHFSHAPHSVIALAHA